MSVWRVGFYLAPCDFTPRHLCGWNHRFDDPKREYRTIYAADEKKTCLREVLADLRPDKKALADFKNLFGDDPALASVGKVTAIWRKKHVLTGARIEVESGKMADIESGPMRTSLSRSLAKELAARGRKRFDAAAIRSQDRSLTRAASRLLYEDGCAGIDFRSRLDKVPCHALFESRARLEQRGAAIPLSGEVSELSAVCAEYGLMLEGTR